MTGESYLYGVLSSVVAFRNPWIRFLASNKPGVVVHSCTLCNQEVEEEGLKFMAILSNIVN